MTNFKLKPLILLILILAGYALIILGAGYAYGLIWSEGWGIKVTFIVIAIVVFGILLPIWLGYRYLKSK